jgi:hypothetical protein
MKNHPVPEHACLNCNHILRGAFNPHSDNAPVPGAATICAQCGHLMVFAADMSLRQPTDKELTAFAGNTDMLDAVQIRILFKRDLPDAK